MSQSIRLVLAVIVTGGVALSALPSHAQGVEESHREMNSRIAPSPTLLATETEVSPKSTDAVERDATDAVVISEVEGEVAANSPVEEEKTSSRRPIASRIFPCLSMEQ
ncbi:hypothetical protein [Lusitaniella coriacea]|uniref:hypothetical protein n=1 Tax=Lusitaniella coriacea TaxID=1983105 RepID=UPI003CEBFF33